MSAIKRSESPPQRGDPPRSRPTGDGAPAEAVDLDPPEHQAPRLSPTELRTLARNLRRLALQYAPEDGPRFDRLVRHVTSEAFAQAQCAGYRIAENPYQALLGMSRAVARSADHRKTAEGRGVSHG